MEIVMGMAAAGDLIGLVFVYCCIYTAISNLIAFVVAIVRPSKHFSVAMSGGSFIPIGITGILLIVPSAGLILFLLAIPSIVALINFSFCRYRYHNACKNTPSPPLDYGLNSVGYAVLCMVVLFPISCTLANPIQDGIEHWTYGRGPANFVKEDIKIGTSMQDVEQQIGRPHSVRQLGDGKIDWVYHTNRSGRINITFDRNEKVVETWSWVD